MDLQQINLSGHIATITSTAKGNLLVAQLRPQNPQDEADMLIQAFDTSLKPIWQQVKLSYATHAIKIVDNVIWFNSGYVLEQLTLEGETVGIVEPLLLPNEWIGDYVIQRELIFICTVKRFARTIEDKVPRILCVDKAGTVLWATNLPILVSDIIKIRVGKWSPDYYNQAMILSDDRILVTYRTESTGIGISYCVNTLNGERIWNTQPKPTGNKIALKDGCFLIGSQGYGAFDTWCYNHEGDIDTHWKTHGYIVISENDTLRIIEMSNRSPSQVHAAILESDGSIQRGDHLEDYYTSYPVLDTNDNMWFWRSGAIYQIDSNLKKYKIYETPLSKHALTTRMLLLSGKLVFASGKDLWSLDIGAVEIAKSHWACGAGNLGANPIV